MRWQPGVTIRDMEKEFIYDALKHFGGNKVAAAAALGISVRTIDNKLARYEGREAPVETKDAKPDQGKSFRFRQNRRANS